MTEILATCNAVEATGLAEQRRANSVESVSVCGIATEFCVRATVMDAVEAGWKTVVLTDLIRSVDEHTTGTVLQEVGSVGIALLRSDTWLGGL